MFGQNEISEIALSKPKSHFNPQIANASIQTSECLFLEDVAIMDSKHTKFQHNMSRKEK